MWTLSHYRLKNAQDLALHLAPSWLLEMLVEVDGILLFEA